MPRARRRSESIRISLGSDLRIASAREAYEQLKAAGTGGAVEIDAAAVERIDAAGLQALAAALAHLRAAKVACRWQDVSAALAQSAAVAGLGEALGIA